jgi:hypothetical protein
MISALDQIKSVAGELAREGYAALAVDLYGGKSTSSREEAEQLRKAVDPASATDTLVSWVGWLQKHPKATGKVATIGWCYGGGWSLDASIATPVDATIVYYGRVDQPADRLARLKGPVLRHFATRDQWITRPMVEGFERAMAEAGKPLTVYWYTRATTPSPTPPGRATTPRTPSWRGTVRSSFFARICESIPLRPPCAPTPGPWSIPQPEALGPLDCGEVVSLRSTSRSGSAGRDHRSGRV